MQNARLHEAQARIKIARRNINNLRYSDDTTLMAKSEEQLQSLLMKVKEDSKKSGLKQHSESEDHGLNSHHFMQIEGETMETVTGFIFLGSRVTGDSDCSHEIKRCLLLGRKVMTNLNSILKTQTLLCQHRSI